MIRDDFFRLSDLHQAALLKARGISLVKIERNGRRTTFCFADRQRCVQILDEFLTGHLLVNALAFSSELKTLRGAILRADGPRGEQHS